MTRYLVFLLLLLGIPLATWSTPIDSLKTLLENLTPGDERVVVIENRLSQFYALRSLDSAIYFNEQALSHVEREANPDAFFQAHFMALSLMIAQNQVPEAIQKAQEVLQWANDSGNPVDFGKVYSALSLIKRRQGQLDSSQYWVKRALAKMESSPPTETTVACLNILARNYEYQRAYDSCFLYYDQAIDLAQELPAPVTMVSVMYNKAIAHYRLGQDTASLQTFTLLIREATKIGAKRPQGRAYSVTAAIYNYLGERDSSLVYIRKGLDLADELTIEKMYGYMALGNYYFEDNALSQSKEAYEKSLNIANQIGSLSRADILLELGNIAVKANDPDEAIAYFEQADLAADSAGLLETQYKVRYEIANALESKGEYGRALQLLESLFESEEVTLLLPAYTLKGQILVAQSKYTQAKGAFSQAQTYAEKVERKEELAQIYQGLAVCDSALRNYQSAFGYMRKYATLEVDRQKERYRESVAEYETRFETQQKESQIQIMEQEQRLSDLELKQRTGERNSFILLALGGILVAILVGVLYLRIRRQQAALIEANQFKNRIFSMIAHDLKGPITGFQALGRIFSHHLAQKNLNPLEAMSYEISRQSSQIKQLLDNLLTWALQQLDVYKPRLEEFYVGDLGEQVMSFFEQTAAAKQVQLKVEVEEELSFHADKSGLMIVLTNLISNAVKFTEEGEVVMRAGKNTGNAFIEIEDTGQGMTQDQIGELVAGKVLTSKPGTKGEIGTGLGWQTIHGLLNQWKGHLQIESQEGKGTLVRIQFPMEEMPA